MAATLQVVLIVAVLAAVHVPLGNYIARVFTTRGHWRVERVAYRLAGVDPDADQRWPVYLRSLLAFSLVGVGLLYLVLRLQAHLPLSLGHPGMSPDLAFNTAISFTTNTSWQSYAGESTLGHLALGLGLGTEAFLSVAVGMAAAVALVRGLTRSETDRLGNFWVDVTRGCTRLVLPLATVGALVLLGFGVVQNLHSAHAVLPLAGGHQAVPGGPVASWESAKLLTGDGGGAFNANSAHPFEDPGSWANLVEIVLMLLIPSAFPRAYGRMVGDRRQGWALAAVMSLLFALSLGAGLAAQHGTHGTVPAAVGSATEGTEVRNGVATSTLFGVAATSSADGAADASYDSFTALGGGVLMATMMLGEVSPGGGGSGLYGLIMVALLAVFLGGLMVGRTPAYLGKRVRKREISLVALYALATPAVLLVASAVVVAVPRGRAGFLNTGAHGLSEGVYAITSAANSNGSAFAGLSANSPFWNVVLGIVMLVARYLPMIFVVALGGAFARQRAVSTSGALPTHSPSFVWLAAATALVVSMLSFAPMLALGPLADGLR